MGRRQVIVQLDDRLVRALDKLARKEGVSRSELLRRAARALIEADWEAEADRKLAESYTRVPQDPKLVEALWRLARENWPDW